MTQETEQKTSSKSGSASASGRNENRFEKHRKKIFCLLILTLLLLTEGGIRVPFVVAWPGKIPGGQVYEQPITTLDVAATAVELAGLETDDKLDGVNLVPFLSGEKSGAPHEFLTWRWILVLAWPRPLWLEK